MKKPERDRRTPSGVVDDARIESAFRARWAELAAADLRDRVRTLANSDHPRAAAMRTRLDRDSRRQPLDAVAAMNFKRVRRGVDGFIREELRATRDRLRRSVLFDELRESTTPRQSRQEKEDLFTLWRYAIGDNTGQMEREAGAKVRAAYSQRIVRAFRVSVANARRRFRRTTLDALERLASAEDAQRDAGSELDVAISAVTVAKARLDEATRQHERELRNVERIDVETAAAERAEIDAVRAAVAVDRSATRQPRLRLVKSARRRTPERTEKSTPQI